MGIFKSKFDKMVQDVDQQGKIYLLDRDEIDPNKDEFHHQSIAENILRVIIENKPPYVIGVFGRWGTGKSSLSNFLKVKLKELDSNIQWVQVSVWNHSPDTLPQASYSELLRGLGRTDEEIKAALSEKRTSTGYDLANAKKNFWGGLKVVGITLGVFGGAYAFLGIIAHLVYELLVGEKITFSGIMQALSKYSWMPFAAAISKFLLDRTTIFDVKKESSPLNSIDQFAREFLNETKGKRVFVLIDDLDRLGPKKIIRALEVMKTYMDSNNDSCVFIVPCDDLILREAVEEVKSLDESSGDRYLEKFFQFSFRLPPHQYNDLKTYANKILMDVNSPLKKLNDFEGVLSLLIYPDVKTPRHVKKLLNEFSALYYMLLEREKGERPLIPAGETTSQLGFIAKLAVLKSDFPDFYAEMEKNPGVLEYIELILADCEVQAYQKELVEKYIKGTMYSESNDNSNSAILPRNESLVRYLKRTSHIYVPDLRPFLYLRADKTHFIIKDQSARTLAADITSGNIRAVAGALEKSSDNGIAIFEFSLQILDLLTGLDLFKGITILYELSYALEYLPQELTQRVANFVVRNKAVIESGFSDPEKAFIFFDAATDYEMRDQFIEYIFEKNHVNGPLILSPWVRELIRRHELCNSNKRLLNLVLVGTTDLGAEDVVSILNGIEINASVIDLLGESSIETFALYILNLDSEGVTVIEEEISLLQSIIDVSTEVFPYLLMKLLVEFIQQGNRLMDISFKTIMDIPTWMLSHELVPILEASCTRIIGTDSNIFDSFLDWILKLHQYIQEYELTRANEVIVDLLTSQLSSNDPDVLVVIQNKFSLFRKRIQATETWQPFETEFVTTLLGTPASPNSDQLRKWMIEIFETLGDNAKEQIKNQAHDWLITPNSLVTTRFARMIVVELRERHRMVVTPSALTQAMFSNQYALDARRETATAVLSMYNSFSVEANKHLVWSSIADQAIQNSNLDEFRFGLELLEQLPWPAPTEVIANLVDRLWTRLPAIGDSEIWNRAFGLISKMIPSLSEQNLVVYRGWIVQHFQRDVAAATRYAIKEWTSFTSEQRASIVNINLQKPEFSGSWPTLVKKWKIVLEGARQDGVLSEFEALSLAGVNYETIESIFREILSSVSVEVLQELFETINTKILESSERQVRERWLVLACLILRRNVRQISLTHLFTHLLTGDLLNQDLGLKYIVKAREQLTSAEDRALESVFSRMIQHVPTDQLSQVIRTVRQISKNTSLTKLIFERAEKEKENLTTEQSNEIKESMKGMRKPKKLVEFSRNITKS